MKQEITLQDIKDSAEKVLLNIETYTPDQLGNYWVIAKSISNNFSEKSKEKQEILSFQARIQKQLTKLNSINKKQSSTDEPINANNYETSEDQDNDIE